MSKIVLDYNSNRRYSLKTVSFLRFTKANEYFIIFFHINLGVLENQELVLKSCYKPILVTCFLKRCLALLSPNGFDNIWIRFVTHYVEFKEQTSKLCTGWVKLKNTCFWNIVHLVESSCCEAQGLSSSTISNSKTSS